MKDFNFATLNVRGIKKKTHSDGSLSLILENILCDCDKRKVNAIAIQETHFGEPGYIFYCVNDEHSVRHGAGILIRDYFNPIFNMTTNTFYSFAAMSHTKLYQTNSQKKRRCL